MDLNFYQIFVYIIADIMYIAAVRTLMFDKKHIFVLAAAYVLADTLMYLWLKDNLLHIIAGWAETAIFIYILSKDRIQSMKMALQSVIAIVTVRGVIILVTSAAAGEMVKSYAKSNMTCVVVYGMSGMVLLIVSLMMAKVRQTENSERITPVYWVLMCFTLVGSVGIVEIFYAVSRRYDDVSISYWLFGIVMVLIIMNIFIFYLYEQQKKYNMTREELLLVKNNIEIQKLFYENEINLYQQRKRQRHDLNNLLMGMETALEAKKYDNLSGMLNDRLDELRKKKLIISGNKNIDAILGYKISVAMEAGIDVSFDVETGDVLGIAADDMVIIMGNAMDNAINASLKTKEPKIDIRVLCRAGMCNIIIKNFVEDKQFITDKKMNSEENEMEYGWGIKGVRSIIEKYNGDMRFISNEEKFLLQILMEER